MDRLDKLRLELFVAEQQLRKTEEEGELKTEKSRKCVTKRSVAKPSKVKSKDSEAKLSTKTVKFPKPSEATLTELRALPSLNAEVSEQLSALGLQSESSESDRYSHDSIVILILTSVMRYHLNLRKRHYSLACTKSRLIQSNFHKSGRILPYNLSLFQSLFHSCLWTLRCLLLENLRLF